MCLHTFGHSRAELSWDFALASLHNSILENTSLHSNFYKIRRSQRFHNHDITRTGGLLHIQRLINLHMHAVFDEQQHMNLFKSFITAPICHSFRFAFYFLMRAHFLQHLSGRDHHFPSVLCLQCHVSSTGGLISPAYLLAYLTCLSGLLLHVLV